MATVTPELLALGLDDLAAGRSTFETLFRDYPATADDLGSLLAIAHSIYPPAATPFDTLTRTRLRAELISQIGPYAKRHRGAWPRRSPWAVLDLIGRPRAFPPGGKAMPALVAALAILVGASFGGGVVFASEATIPGDTLYVVKLSVENVRVALATNDNSRAEALVNRADQRLAEIEEASAMGRVGAAEIAADAYLRDMSEVSGILERTSGPDVSVFATRVAADLARQQDSLAAAKQTAPYVTLNVVARADESAQYALTVARERAGGAVLFPAPIGTPTNDRATTLSPILTDPPVSSTTARPTERPDATVRSFDRISSLDQEEFGRRATPSTKTSDNPEPADDGRLPVAPLTVRSLSLPNATAIAKPAEQPEPTEIPNGAPQSSPTPKPAAGPRSTPRPSEQSTAPRATAETSHRESSIDHRPPQPARTTDS